MPIQPIPSSSFAEAAHYGRKALDQGTVPLYPIAHVLGAFDQQGKKQFFWKLPVLPALLSQRKGISLISICLPEA